MLGDGREAVQSLYTMPNTSVGQRLCIIAHTGIALAERALSNMVLVMRRMRSQQRRTWTSLACLWKTAMTGQ